jgi:hypothetical protein
LQKASDRIDASPAMLSWRPRRALAGAAGLLHPLLRSHCPLSPLVPYLCDTGRSSWQQASAQVDASPAALPRRPRRALAGGCWLVAPTASLSLPPCPLWFHICVTQGVAAGSRHRLKWMRRLQRCLDGHWRGAAGLLHPLLRSHCPPVPSGSIFV